MWSLCSSDVHYPHTHAVCLIELGGGGGEGLSLRVFPPSPPFLHNRSDLTASHRVHAQKAVLSLSGTNREWTHCCGRGWIVTGCMMCSFASCRKGKHMCAHSVGNKLLCGIHHWPDVMDKCQTNALTPLLDQPRRKEITEQNKKNLLVVSQWGENVC